jgi:prepilin-type N-terminal cleavage/methylation domain-containing protein
MTSRGFTLIEVLVVIAIIGILSSIGTFQFSQYTTKSAIERQTREMYTDMIEQRSKALFEKKSRGVRVTASTFALYSSASDGDPRVLNGNPFVTTTLRYPIISNNYKDIIFDTGGMLDTASSQSICVTEANSASIDSIIVSETRIRLGKLKEGTDCASDHINAK